MKKTLFFVLIMIFALSASTVSASISGDNNDVKDIKAENASENFLTEEEAELLTLRIEEIREMDKSELSSEEKHELRNELKDIKKEIQRQGGVLYIGVGTLLIVILLILLLT